MTALLARLLYEGLLALYPGAFRRRCGDALRRDLARALAEADGPGRRAAVGLRELWDLARNLGPAWWEAVGGRAGRAPADGSGPERAAAGLPAGGPDGGRGSGAARGWALDVRLALRGLARSPGFTAAVVLTLGLGIGAASTVFAVVDAVLLEPLPYPAADRLVHLRETYRESEHRSVSYPNYRDWREMNRSFRDLGARTSWSFNLTGDGPAESVEAMLVSPNFLELLGVEPVLGRGFDARDAEREPRLALVSRRLWRERLGGDPGAVGRSLTLDGEPFTVVGVLPDGLEYPIRDAEVLAPLQVLSERDRTTRSSHPGLIAVGRLREGATMSEARRDMARVVAALAEAYPDANAEAGVEVTRLLERYVGSTRRVLLPLLAGVGLFLLVACVNAAGLVLARTVRRGRDTAVRVALGAGRGRAVRHLLLESLVLGAAGGGLGLLLARLGTDLFRGMGAGSLPRIHALELDGTVVAVTGAIAVAASLAVGLVPALRGLGGDPATALRGRGTGGGAGARLRAGLVVSEVALAFVLLVSAGLMLRSVERLRSADPGYRPEGVLAAYVGPSIADYPEPDDRARLFRRALERIEALPDVSTAGGVDPLPLTSNRQWTLAPEGLEGVGEDGLRVDVSNATPGYFRTMGIDLVAGRAFDGTETEDAAVAVVDESLARRLWPGASPLGRRLRFRGSDVWFTVAGVVEHVSHYGVQDEGRPQLYVPYTVTVHGLYLVARTDGDPRSLAPGIREILGELAPAVPLTRVHTLEASFRRSVARETMAAALLAVFGAASLLLAVVGLYGMVAYSVSVRTRELGIRIAVGAPGPRLVTGVVGRSVGLVLAGVAVGAAGAAAATRLLGDLLFRVGAADPASWAGAALVLVLVAVGAAAQPARRAVRTDPTRALRPE